MKIAMQYVKVKGAWFEVMHVDVTSDVLWVGKGCAVNDFVSLNDVEEWK